MIFVPEQAIPFIFGGLKRVEFVKYTLIYYL